MKAIPDERLADLESLAMEGAQQIRAYFKYQGTDTAHLNKARVGATVISGYARLRASETNRMAVELAMGREIAPPPVKRLKGGDA